MFTFSVLNQEYPFTANLVKNIKDFLIKLKLGAYINSNMQNSVMCSLFLF